MRTCFSLYLPTERYPGSGRSPMPILAISGSRDRLSDEKPVAIFISKVAHGRLLQYPGAGHFSYVDDPTRFAEDVTSFLR